MFLRFFGFDILALEIGERHIQRLMSQWFAEAAWVNFRIADKPSR
jgi:hypothetical protein